MNKLPGQPRDEHAISKRNYPKIANPKYTVVPE
jgi:hypothetical protein